MANGVMEMSLARYGSSVEILLLLSKLLDANEKDRSASVVVRNTFVGVLCNEFSPSLAGTKIPGGGDVKGCDSPPKTKI